MKQVIRLQGLDCANCAAELEAIINKIEGVSAATLAFVTQKLTVEYDGEETLEKILYEINHFEEVSVVNDGGGRCERKKSDPQIRKQRFWQWSLIVFSAAFFLAGVLLERLGKGTIAQVFTYICYGIAYLAVGYPVLIATAKNISKGKIFDENFLMTVASVGAMLLGEFSESVLVMLLYQIGETLQAIAVDSSRKSVSLLMDLKSERAIVFKGREQKEVAPEEIAVGDILFVKAGERVPVDGVLIDREARLDTKSLTGEAELSVVKTGEKLISGCINAGTAFTMRTTHAYEDSAVKRILDLVENASSSKATPEKFITKFAKWYTPIVCILALALAFIVPPIHGLITDGAFVFKDFTRWVHAALTFLVVSCPSALIISVPLTYFSGIGACAKQGVLVKGATYLDTLAKATAVAFDKTGTLTEGDFGVCEVYTNGDENELLSIAATVEKSSAHPIAKAFADIKTPYKAETVEEKAGRGLLAKINGETVLVGNDKFLKEYGVAHAEITSPHTLVFVARNGVYLGAVAVGDKLRAEARETVQTLKTLGFKRTVILTGDNAERANAIADEVGITEVRARLLPDEKLQEAETLKRENKLVYIGDGINDAPVMATADCAVSMGKLGSAAAVEASDLVLVSDNLKALPCAVKTARKTRAVVMQNIVFSIAMKSAFMVLGAIGVLPLGLAVFADVGVMLLAVLNSFRVRIK